MAEASRSIQSFKAGWSNVDQAANPNYYVRCTEILRPQHADTAEYQRFADMLQLQPGDSILDVGCGTGGGVRAMAELVGSSGSVVGVDKSATMIAEAHRLGAGSAGRTEYLVADAHALPFADNTFLGCYADGLFDILDVPEQALTEMIRVTQIGGRVATWAPDSIIIDASDRALTRRIVDWICDTEVNGWLGRQLPRLFKERGMTEVRTTPTVEVHTNYGVAYQLWLRPFLDHALEAGVITTDESATWCAELLKRALAGHFMFAWSFFWVSGQKPW